MSYVAAFKREEWESGYMPRNFSELKSGGTIPMLSPHAEKRPPRPPPIAARARAYK